MARESLVDMAVGRILDDVITGAFPPGESLPPESELAARLDVSRLTLREAVKILQTQNVVSIVRGKRHRVNPVDEWTGVEPVLRAAAYGENRANASVQLIELRRMIETGASELAAVRRTDDDLESLRRFVGEMRSAHEAGDVDAFVTADIAFHDVILKASGNVFLRVLLEPLGRLLYERRFETSSVTVVQVHAIAMHQAVLDALDAGEPRAAREAMDRHMDQTAADLRRYVLDLEAG